MVRGKRNGKDTAGQGGLPRFVDIRLDAGAREAFSDWFRPDGDPVSFLQEFADTGYRVGVSWSGEHQSYTVSATCRDGESPNSGMCMTAFSGDLAKAVALLWYKHTVVSEGVWESASAGSRDDFG